MLAEYLSAESCPILHLFFDWNPICTEDFASVRGNNNDLYEVPEGELHPFAKLLKQNNRLQVLFLRASGVTD